MPQPRVIILRAPGTNCDAETEYAFGLAGGRAERVHVNRLLEQPKLLSDSQILCLPGGFSYGDDLGAGQVLGHQLARDLAHALGEFKEQSKLILGICNGFQVLVRSGILVPPDDRGPAATLTWNDSGRFEDRWVYLRAIASQSIFFAGVEFIYLPVAHAEGKFVPRDLRVLGALQEERRIVLRYTAAPDSAASHDDRTAASYPANPNGSVDDIAALCDATGRVCGLMPHPERFVDPTQHPRWTRGTCSAEGDGLVVFRNAVRYFQ